MKNREVCEDFINSRSDNKTRNLIIATRENGNRVLYSYGLHFPIAVLLNDNNILINLDGYSQTTAIHKGHFARALGFNNFKELRKSKSERFLFLSTVEIEKILNKGLTTKTAILCEEI